MRRRVLAVLAAVAVVLGLGGAPALARGAAAPTDGGWYLALGDSYGAGYQPGAGSDLTGGYAGPVLTALQRTSPGAQLENLSCPSEDLGSFLEGGPYCSYAGSQLDQALAFLSAHPDTRLITIDIGGNDVQDCVDKTSGSLDLPCLQAGLTTIRTRLPGLLSQLAAAAPDAQIILSSYPDVFLAAWLTGASGQQLARLSVSLVGNLDGIFADAAASAGVDFADVSEAFSTTDFDTMVDDPTYGQIPLNVSQVCALTWMCSRRDIHPNDAGYALIGSVIAARLDQTATSTTTSSTASTTTSSTTPPMPTSSTTTATAASTSGSAGPQTPAVVQTDGSAPEGSAVLLLLGTAGAIALGVGVVQSRRRAGARH